MPCQCIYKMHWNASNKLYFQSSVLVWHSHHYVLWRSHL
jgi:hypothetical protein